MEEITFAEILQILFKGKKLISIVTAIFFIGSLLIAFFVLEPVYESQTMLMISPITNTKVKENDNNFIDLVSSLSQYPLMTIDTYREQVKAPVILQYLRKELDMEDIPLSNIANKIKVNAIDKTNLITISVKDKDPEIAAEIANLISNKFTEFVTETNKKQAKNSAEFIKEQMESEKVNMEESSKKLEEFLAKPRGPQELKFELDGKLVKITEYKTTLSQVQIDLHAAKSSLEQAKNLLQSTPKTLVTKKTLVNDNLLSELIKDKTGLSTTDIAKLTLTDEEVNQVYVTLSELSNQLELEVTSLTEKRVVLEKQIADIQKEIEELQAELANKQQEYELLQHELDLTKQTYDAYQSKYKEAMIKQSAEIGASSIVVISEAIPPINPVEPRKVLIVGISTLAGFFVSFSYLFIKEYWLRSMKITQKQSLKINTL